LLELCAQHAYMIAVLPVIAFAIVLFTGRRTPGNGALLPILTMGVSFLWSVGCLAYMLTGGEPIRLGFLWAVAGDTFWLSYTVDAASTAMLVMVSLVALLVIIYSQGYMHGDPGYSLFFAYLSLFSASMLGLVLASNLILLFICWELVGLMSYLLIGFWFHKPEAARACTKAFMTTRIGDAGITVAIGLLFLATRSLDLETIFQKVAAGEVSQQMLFVISLGLFAGAVGKSAQFPLHVWLPDAMEGPTPVSALIHAATMVAAGVWMVYRMSPVISATAGQGPYDATVWIAGIGGFTALFSATIAIAQDDIKRVLAYSTISQLGYMMLGLGVGAWFAGFFHLLTHAFFKALLFLGSGAVIIACHHEQDMKKMGGLAHHMPVTFWTFVIGTLALAGAGIPGLLGLSGFHSKEMILAAAWMQARPLAVMALCGAFLTPFYMTRCVCLTFFGKTRDRHLAEHITKVPLNMTVPLVILSVFAVSAGWIAKPLDAWLQRGYGFQSVVQVEELAAAHGEELEAAHHAAELTVAWIAFGCVALGIGLGLALWGRGPERTAAMVRKSAALRALRTLLARKYYIDEFYGLLVHGAIHFMIWVAVFDLHVLDRVFVRGWGWLVLQLKSIAGWVDRVIVDKILVHAGPCAVFLLGAVLQMLQTGSVHFYLLVTAIGGVAFIGISLFPEDVPQVMGFTIVAAVVVAAAGATLTRVGKKAPR